MGTESFLDSIQRGDMLTTSFSLQGTGNGPSDSGSDGSMERAVLVGLETAAPSVWNIDDSMGELAHLTETAGAAVVATVVQKKGKPDPACYVGEGKAREIEMVRSATEANVVIFDDELTPAQQRNLEEIIDGRVIDRTELILDIFAQRAATSEGKLQVELAQLNYMLPRLAGRGTELSRLGGGIGTRGPGETKLEADRRTIRNRISSISKELEAVRQRRTVQRQKRRDAHLPLVALVGYTNAGKSSLLNTLTGAEALVEDKLFATLDPTTRKYTLPDGQALLLTDTVGFIQKLPHHLIMAFRATLEEVVDADMLLHVVDASHPRAMEHCEAVFDVLREIDAADHPVVTVLNKSDLPESGPMIERLHHAYPKSVGVSTVTGEGLDDLAEMISEELSSWRVRLEEVIPYGDPVLALIRARGTVISEEYREDGVAIVADVDRVVADQAIKARPNGSRR